jgi:hypothetical protein
MAILTTEQLVNLKAAILSETDASFVANRTAGSTGAMADFYNTATATMVWKPRVTIIELLNSVVWSDFITLPQEKRDAWFALTQGGAEGVDATITSVRVGFATIFGGASDTVTNLTAVAQRPATRYEVMYTINGVCSVFGTIVSNDDIVKALAA